MLVFLLVVLILLWFFGYIQINGLAIPNITLFSINGHIITLWSLLIFLVIGTIIGVLPNPFRAIASVFFVLWILSVLGILAFAGLSSIIVIAIILGLIVYVLSGLG